MPVLVHSAIGRSGPQSEAFHPRRLIPVRSPDRLLVEEIVKAPLQLLNSRSNIDPKPRSDASHIAITITTKSAPGNALSPAPLMFGCRRG